MTRKNWTREELVVAFNLYCRTTFGRIHNRNPEIIALSRAIGRTPSALSWKLANFARFDPAVTGRNLSGATHGGKLEEEVWNEFNENWDRLAFESEELRASFLKKPLEEIVDEDFPEGLTRSATVTIRVNQGFFRASVLAAYEGACCITGLAVSELLSASHIVPWSVDLKNRANPRNGLCLNALHDRAFDRGLISISPDMRVEVSPILLKLTDISSQKMLLSYEGTQLRLPKQFKPDPEFLAFHRKEIFRQL